MPYSGSGKLTYWASLGYNGTGSPGILSEQVPVVVDGATQYYLNATAVTVDNWSSGYRIQLSFYDVNSSLTGTSGWVNSGPLTNPTNVTINTVAMLAPANSATCQAQVELIGSPTTDNLLQLFEADVYTTSNTAQPTIVNQNYGFVHTTDPWTTYNACLLDWNFSPLSLSDGDFDSLIIDDVIELMGGSPGVQSLLPELLDAATGRAAIYRIHAPGGASNVGQGFYDLGAPQPTADVVESMLLDGERPFGRRASNRDLTLTIMVFAPSLTTLAAAREMLLSVIDQQTWKLTWRPAESGLPMDFECFRAKPSVVTYGFNYNRPASATSFNPATWAISVITINFQALPYGKSGQDGVQVVNFTNGILDGGTVTPSVLLDDYSTVNATSPGGGTWRKNTAYYIGTSQSARYTAPIPMKMPWAAAQYTATGLTLNLTGLTHLYLWLGQSYDNQWPADKKFVSNVTLSWTLTDVNNHTLSFSGRYNKCPWGTDPNKPVWVRVSSAIPQGRSKAQFDYARVTGYTVRITNWAGSGTTGYVRMHAWISQALAVAPTTKWVNTPHASVYSVFGLSGMARSPMSAQVQLPAANSVSQEITQTGTWPVPKGVTQVKAESWGGGGGGGSVSGVTGGMGAGGGGAGEYAAENVVTTIPGTRVPVTIGAGGSGGQVVDRTVTFTRAGPNTWVVPANVSVVTATLWGAGAAGAAGGGGGGGGAYTLGTVNVTAGTTITITVGKGGTPNTSFFAKDRATRHGSDSTVTGTTGTLRASGGQSFITGGTNGGSGGAALTVAASGTTITASYPGGNGGRSPGAAGGGGGSAGKSSAPGGTGGDSPRGSNNYGTGGPGGIGDSVGGNGGKGADVGGTPVKGVTPGGGGGGGYTKTVNYAGAVGGDGKVILTYRENLGNPINGGTTTFGASGFTNKVVTAHGGSSPSLNSPNGGAVGTGSTNTIHYNGGTGGVSGNNSNYLYRANDNGGPFFLQYRGTQTGASVTSTAAANNQSTGLSIVTITATAALNALATVTDSSGNTYDLMDVTSLPSSAVNLYTYIARIGAPLTTSSTLTVSNNGISNTYTINWYGTVQYADVDASFASIASATSTAPGIQVTNPDIGTHKGYFVVMMNNSTTNVSATVPDPGSYITSDGATSSAFNSGTVYMHHFIKELPGASGNNTIAATYGSSVPWAVVMVPLIPQDVADPTLLKVTTTNSTGTTVALSFANGFNVPANRGMMLLLCQFAGTPGTVTFTDASGNTWSQITTVTVGSSVFRAYTTTAANAYTTSSTVTLNDTTSQAHCAALYYVHEANGVDSALITTNTGTSAAPSITTLAGTWTNDLEAVIYINNNSVDTTSGPSGFVPWQQQASGTMSFHMYGVRVPGRTTYTATAAYAGSQTWGAVAFGFISKVFGGSGASSGGPLGPGNDGTDSGGSAWEGGGKGANSLIGAAGGGLPAALPGGGGAGAASWDTSSFVGGSGASGMVRLTWTPPLKTFNDLILHRPGDDSKNSLCPVVTIPPNDPPDNREYAVPSLVSGKNAEFNSTYTVIAVANAWNSATTGSSRRLSVTVNQYEYKGGPAVSVQATRVLTPATDIVNGYVTMGELTLPIKDYDEANDDVYYTISIHDTDTGDSFQDIIFLDTAGQTVLVNIAPGTAADSIYSSYFIDEPTSDRALGRILGSGYGRERAVSVLDMAVVTGGPLYLSGGENILLAYSTGGSPNLGVTYNPRWYLDRIK